VSDEEEPRILRELAAAAAEHRRYAEALDRARARRDFLIVKARAAGCSLRRIARAAGVTYGRVHQITRTPHTSPRAGQKKHRGRVGATHRSPATRWR
jgi:hypothetical protein